MSSKPQSTLSPETLAATKRLGGALKRGRVRRRLTQAQLAARADIGVATVQRMERGDPGLSLGAFFEVLAVLEREWIAAVIQPIESDPTGLAIEQRRLPSRVVIRHDDF